MKDKYMYINFWLWTAILFSIAIMCFLIFYYNIQALPEQKELCFKIVKDKLITINQIINAENKNLSLPEIYCIISSDKCKCTLDYTFNLKNET